MRSSSDQMLALIAKAIYKASKYLWSEFRKGKINLHISDGMITIEHPEHNIRIALELPQVD